jgi:hypothetical protein
MTLAVVIVTYNSAAEIGACLASLTGDLRPGDTVVVVDNASSDGTRDLVRREWPAVTVVDAGGNLGFAAATNLGIRHSTSDLLLLLNPDTIVPPGAIHTLVSWLAAHPAAAVVGPRLVDGSGRPELSFGATLGPLAELRQKLLVRGHQRKMPLVSSYVTSLTRRTQSVDWVSGACLLVRRADADAVGLLDERFFMYIEDIDFCAAIRSRGRGVYFCADVEVGHLRGRSVATASAATAVAYRRSQLAFYAKHRPAIVPFIRAYLRLTGSLPTAPDAPRP